MRIAAFILVLTSMLACHSTRQMQKTEPDINTPGTTTPVAPAEKVQPISSSVSENVFKNVFKNYIDYGTFNAKVRVKYESKEGADEATAVIRLKKDSAVWLSLRGALGIEGARVLITKDSVKVLNFLKKNVQNHSIDYLQKMMDFPLDLKTVQDIIIGNPVFVDTTATVEETSANNQIVIQMIGKVFKNMLTLDNTDLTIVHAKIEDATVSGKRTCEIRFDNYEKSSDVFFSTVRKIWVADQSGLVIDLAFKQFAFNQPETFPFNIPKNYQRL
jgi:hypothetical protein